MAEISASMVMDLRQRTGLGMMECKKALTEAGGDLAKAEELLRIKSGAKASKAARRVAAEGVIGLHVAADGKTGGDDRGELRDRLRRARTTSSWRSPTTSREMVARDNPADVAALSARDARVGRDVEARRIGAGAEDRREHRRSAASRARVATGTHRVVRARRQDRRAGRRSTAATTQLGKDLAMHIAAIKPVALSPAERRRRS